VTSERKREANRRNARASTGPRTAAGKARVAHNARRHGLNVAVALDPALAADAEALARAICRSLPAGGRGDGAASTPRSQRAARLLDLARRVAEAEIDVVRVRRARHDLMAQALANPRYLSSRNLRSRIALLGRAGDFLVRGLQVPPDLRDAIHRRPQGALKFALILGDLAGKLAALDRYERRALSRRKAAVRAFDAARAGEAGILVPLPAFTEQPGRAPTAGRVRRPAAFRRNKANATSRGPAPPPATTKFVRPWGDKPTSQVSYREAAAYVCKLLNLDWTPPSHPRDGPPDRDRV
jgi:hypothetical protein